MIFGKTHTIKEGLIGALKEGPVRTAALIKRFVQQRPRVSKQGVYLPLRQLSKEEVVVIYKKYVSLNRQWLTRMGDFFTDAHKNYFEPDIPVSQVKNLRPRQRLTFTFKTLTQLDAFWCHTLYALIEHNPTHEPIFTYNPHWWFGYSRSSSELTLIDFCRRHNTPFLETVGHDTPIDRKARKMTDGTYAQYSIREKPMAREHNYYFNVSGDFIFDVWIDKKIHEKIEYLYHNHTTVTKEWLAALESLNQVKGKSVFIISRNPKRADDLRKKLSRPFYIPRVKN